MTEASSTRRAVLCLILAVSLLLLAACASKPKVTFVTDGGSLTKAQVENAAAKVDISSVSSIDVAEAAKTRTEALVELRRKGPEAGKAADLLTRAFPLKAVSVPLYVEAATVDGQPAWVVVEAWGEKTGKLVHRRLWVFDRANGDLLGSRSWM